MKIMNKNNIILIIFFLISGSFISCSKKKKKKTTPAKNINSKQKSTIQDKSTNADKPKIEVATKIGSNSKQSDVKTKPKQQIGQNSTTNAQNPAQNPNDSKSKNLSKLSKEKTKQQQIQQNLKEAEILLYKNQSSAYNQSIKICLSILKKDFKNYKAMLIMAKAYRKLNNYDKMYSILNYISSIRKKDHPPSKVGPMWHLLMGKYYMYIVNQLELRGFMIDAIRQKTLAEKQFSQALQYIDAKMILGVLYLEKGLYQKSARLLEDVEKTNPKIYGWKLYLNLGVVYFYLKNYLKAVTKLDYAISLNRKCYKCHYNLALIYNDWANISKIGRMSEKERSQKLIYHAKIYLKYLKSKRNKDKPLIKRLKSWIREATSKL